jgi:hypothetical protein
VVFVRFSGNEYVVVTGSILDSGRPHELYVVQNALPRPSVKRVRLPFRSYPNEVLIDAELLSPARRVR